VTYVSPRRDAQALIREVYGPDYWRSPRPRERGYGDYAADAELHHRTFERRWKTLASKLPQGTRLLDVGCAQGSFLSFMAGRGWQVQGLEPSASMAALAQQQLGAQQITQATLEQAHFEPESFDLITLWDVLEHLPHPVEGLRRVAHWLAPQGRAVIETQDISSWMARACGARWQHFKHDEHLVHFTPETLAAACQQAGLRLVHWQRRAAGKYVRGSFLVERSARISPWLPRLLRPILGGDWSVYVNPMDEIIATVERQR
jgi:2-polyprenyl-3-methyl-5-hydroxy-6-metoxy-1,4-benzoquinol methylase